MYILFLPLSEIWKKISEYIFIPKKKGPFDQNENHDGSCFLQGNSTVRVKAVQGFFFYEQPYWSLLAKDHERFMNYL